MDIIEAINKKISEYNMKMGFRPTCIYVGEDEWFLLKKHASRFNYRCRTIENDGDEYMGLKVHRVVERYHLNVG